MPSAWESVVMFCPGLVLILTPNNSCSRLMCICCLVSPSTCSGFGLQPSHWVYCPSRTSVWFNWELIVWQMHISRDHKRCFECAYVWECWVNIFNCTLLLVSSCYKSLEESLQKIKWKMFSVQILVHLDDKSKIPCCVFSPFFNVLKKWVRKIMNGEM